MAEGLLRVALKDEAGVRVVSAGVAAMSGQPASRETQQVLNKMGASLKGFKSQQVHGQLLKQADLIIAMTSSHADVVKRHFSAYTGSVSLLCDYVAAEEGLAGADIPDPIGMGMDAYEEVAEVMELAMPGILNAINQP